MENYLPEAPTSTLKGMQESDTDEQFFTPENDYIAAKLPLTYRKDEGNKSFECSSDEEESETLSPASRCSSDTSISSCASLSPVTPLKRFKKRIGEKENTVTASAPQVYSTPPDFKQAYKNLLTKYFKAKKRIKLLRGQNIHDQKRIALLEFARQQEALQLQEQLGSQNSQSQKTDFNSEGNRSQFLLALEWHGEQESNMDVAERVSTNTTEMTDILKDECPNPLGTIFDVEEPSSSGTCGQGGSCQESEKSAEGEVHHDMSRIECEHHEASYPQIKNDLVRRMAAVISDESLRPVIFKVSCDSPPSKLPSVIEKLGLRGNLCANCGRRMERKRK